jgi:hypothetical protein
MPPLRNFHETPSPVAGSIQCHALHSSPSLSPRVGRERLVTEFRSDFSPPFELCANDTGGAGWDSIGHGRLRHERAISARAEAPNTACDPSSVSMRISWLYLATRSDRAIDPVLT